MLSTTKSISRLRLFKSTTRKLLNKGKLSRNNSRFFFFCYSLRPNHFVNSILLFVVYSSYPLHACPLYEAYRIYRLIALFIILGVQRCPNWAISFGAVRLSLVSGPLQFQTFIKASAGVAYVLITPVPCIVSAITHCTI